MIVLALIAPRRRGRTPTGELLDEYLKRSARYHPVTLRELASEQELVSMLEERNGRSTPLLVITDGRGEPISSEELAATLGSALDSGVQRIVIAIGPADGWSAAMLTRAKTVLAFGRITLPHELAAVVAAEQIYRALTIRAGHPYHSGH